MKGLGELDFALYISLISLYLQNPLDHVYMLYDLIYELDKTELYISGRGDVVEAYMLIWRGQKYSGIHLWNYSEDFKRLLKEALPAIIQLYRPSDLEKVAGALKEAGVEFKAEVYLDMVVDEERFRPYRPQEAVRLDPGRYVGEFVELKKAQGADIDERQAVELIKKRRCYGVFKDGRLVSITCRYVALPEVWIIGDVFTLPEYRGHGYGKIATSAITRDAVASGAVAYLHVNKKNVAATSLYAKLGYSILRERPWIFAPP
nr:GNAT family N-acetyltransferase [Pyrobaculum arsenaticum]